MCKKILVVRYRYIGDTILSVPFLRNLRYNYPNAQIDVLVSSGSGEIIEDCPYIDNFIFFDITRHCRYEKKNKKSFWSYVFSLKKEKYDKVYILKRSLTSALLCFYMGAKERIGYDTENRGFLLTKKVKYDADKHESLCFLDVLKSDGLEVKDYYLENWISEENSNKIKAIFEENKIKKDIKKAVVSVTATNQGKCWDVENYAEIIEYLSNEKRVQVIFIGAPIDKEVYDNLKYSQDLKIAPLNLCGKVNLKDSLALLKEVDFILGNDSGTLHMASSVNTKVIGLYGPMPFEKWKALGNGNIYIKANLPCMPCSLRGKCKDDYACMKAITINQVKQAVDKMLIQ